MYLFRASILCALVWVVCAFHVPFKRLQSRQYSTAIYAASSTSVEPGKLLYDAAVDNDVAKMKIAIKECNGNKDQINFANPQRYGRTPLVIACYYNNVDAVKLLLSTPGVDVNKGIDFGSTALMYAAHRGHAESVKLLLADKRTNVNARGSGGRWTNKTALKLVTEMRGYTTENSAVADLLRAKGAIA